MGSYADSLAQAVELNRVGGLIGVTINGVEIRGCWGGSRYPTCNDYATSATYNEGDTFEYCGGHGSPYHYHQAPICLLQQMGSRTDGSSPLIGWAADGFPIYGNRGPNGVLIQRCGSADAHATYCADRCGGYYGEDYNDTFKYRYFLMGSDHIPNTNPLPILGEQYFPFAPFCLLGCGSTVATGTDRSPSIGREMKACTGGASVGTVVGYSPVATPGVVASYQPTFGEWFSLPSSDGSSIPSSTTSQPAVSSSRASPTQSVSSSVGMSRMLSAAGIMACIGAVTFTCID